MQLLTSFVKTHSLLLWMQVSCWCSVAAFVLKSFYHPQMCGGFSSFWEMTTSFHVMLSSHCGCIAWCGDKTSKVWWRVVQNSETQQLLQSHFNCLAFYQLLNRTCCNPGAGLGLSYTPEGWEEGRPWSCSTAVTAEMCSQLGMLF